MDNHRSVGDLDRTLIRYKKRKSLGLFYRAERICDRAAFLIWEGRNETNLYIYQKMHLC